MRVPAVGEAASRLALLTPSAASLVALARTSAVASWPELRSDPGFVLLALRQPSRTPDNSASGFSSRLGDVAMLESALRYLDEPGAGRVALDSQALASIYQSGVAFARLAALVAGRTGKCDPECAWASGLLVPLGWFAVAAVAPQDAAACLDDCQGAGDPEAIQVARWGFDASGIARRLCRRWQLPRWLSAVVGSLDLTAEAAQGLGALPGLFRITQLAVGLAAGAGAVLRPCLGGNLGENATELGLGPAELESLAEAARDFLKLPPPPGPWTAPADLPLMRDLLQLAIANRRLASAPAVTVLEDDADRLHRALRQHYATEDDRLRAQKLRALAEFAGGAGHEINNPLAVISGQAQYLLTQEADPARQRSLHKIVGQAQRIHQILTDLMQFARPSQPDKQEVFAAALVADAVARSQDLAELRHVRLEAVPCEPSWVAADPKQALVALACLVRNAVEATPPDGWTAVRVERVEADRVEFVVEDSGGGPALKHLEHLFDPFYSGREAGRGRGLGLPTAWQLAHVNGGDVRYDGTTAGTARFVLSLPRSTAASSVALVPAPAPTLPPLEALPGIIPLNGHVPD